MRNCGWAWLVVMAVPLMAADVNQSITQIAVTPAELTLRSADEGVHVLVTGTTADGEKIDLTSSAQFAPAEPLVNIGSDGLLHAVRQGETKVVVTAGGREAQVDVHVTDHHTPPPITSVRDGAPILNKVGCTSGTCHGSAKGKNGFKLSLRGYDPEFDYEALLYDMSGRRFNRP